MIELTLKQKNDMIDFMVAASAAEWSYTPENTLMRPALIRLGIYPSVKNVILAYYQVFPELHALMGSNWFSTQSERIIYLLLVKEFINR